MRKKKGFTLIELVMVIVILGILAAIAIPKFISLAENARRASCQGSLGALRTAISAYYAQQAVTTGSAAFPANISVLSTYMAEGAIPANVCNVTWNDYYCVTTGVLNDSACPDNAQCT